MIFSPFSCGFQKAVSFRIHGPMLYPNLVNGKLSAEVRATDKTSGIYLFPEMFHAPTARLKPLLCAKVCS